MWDLQNRVRLHKILVIQHCEWYKKNFHNTIYMKFEHVVVFVMPWCFFKPVMFSFIFQGYLAGLETSRIAIACKDMRSKPNKSYVSTKN